MITISPDPTLIKLEPTNLVIVYGDVLANHYTMRGMATQTGDLAPNDPRFFSHYIGPGGALLLEQMLRSLHTPSFPRRWTYDDPKDKPPLADAEKSIKSLIESDAIQCFLNWSKSDHAPLKDTPEALSAERQHERDEYWKRLEVIGPSTYQRTPNGYFVNGRRLPHHFQTLQAFSRLVDADHPKRIRVERLNYSMFPVKASGDEYHEGESYREQHEKLSEFAKAQKASNILQCLNLTGESCRSLEAGGLPSLRNADDWILLRVRPRSREQQDFLETITAALEERGSETYQKVLSFVNANDLRSLKVTISNDLTWERTIHDLTRYLDEDNHDMGLGPKAEALKTILRRSEVAVISFGACSAVLTWQNGSQRSYVLLCNLAESEEELMRRVPGHIRGLDLILIMAIVAAWHKELETSKPESWQQLLGVGIDKYFLNEQQERGETQEPSQAPLIRSLVAGLFAARFALVRGFTASRPAVCDPRSGIKWRFRPATPEPPITLYQPLDVYAEIIRQYNDHPAERTELPRPDRHPTEEGVAKRFNAFKPHSAINRRAVSQVGLRITWMPENSNEKDFARIRALTKSVMDDLGSEFVNHISCLYFREPKVKRPRAGGRP